MRIFIAHDTDTLRTVARQCNVELESLISLNPYIDHPDSNIAGMSIKLPDLAAAADNRTNVPSCPPASLDFNEQWIPLTTLEEMERTDYDVLIVGSGAGGGAVLWRLAEQLGTTGTRIAVLERGGLLLPTHAQNIATMDIERVEKYFHTVSKSPPGYHSSQTFALGGRTLFWTVACPRMPVSEIAGWPVTLKEMDFYYNLAEKAMNVTQNFTKSASITQILLRRLQMNGFSDAIDEPQAMNLEPASQYGVINSNAFFSSIVFFAQALNRPFDLAVNARVVQVLTEKGRAVGVKVMSPDKKSYFIKAKNVVLAASTFGTPQILLNSEIEGRAIGHYLINHSRVMGTAILNRSEFPEVLGPLRILVPGNDRPYQIQILGPGPYYWVQYKVQPLQEKWEILLAASGKVEAKYDNKVSLDPVKRDAYGLPELQVDFSFSELDKAVIQIMGEGMQQAASAMNTPLISRDGQPPLCLVEPGLENHDMGTCRMGEDPFTSATNQYGQIHGIQGLYVADNSVIPTSGTANPTLTCVALAIRTADYIVQQLK
ncbi:GMC oxidoreductase [Paenibacillus spongiae]|uniref:GMC family oxidoreductase n=1 Tax=Paenibacillus spongiae TaxID=2909671 RepID=A0ABY5SJD8_9BACL|nr:GMC family oxidoreductase [Paenibacillus spongiae]UVI32625.1 GMC family oxidoreductase [Paenibacillus spongiae]